MEPAATKVVAKLHTKVAAFQWRHLIVQCGLMGLVRLLVAFKQHINSSFYFKTILSKLARLLTSLLSQGEVLRTKVKKICEGFHAAVYPCPEVTFLPLP